MLPADPHLTPQAPAAAHLPAAVLRQYAAGTLTPAERRRVENHTLDCALCADALEGYQQAEPAAISPAALTELRQRLHARVAAEPARAPRVGAWWMAAAATILLLAFVGVWQWQRPAQNTAAVGPRPRPAAAPAARPEPAVAAAPVPDSVPPAAIAAAEAELAEVPAAAPAATAPPRPDTYAANTARVRARRSPSLPAPAVARVEAPAATEAASDAAILEESAGRVAVEVAAAPPAAAPAPALAKPAAEPESKAKVAASRMAEVAAAPASATLAATDTAPAPAKAQPPLREEGSKRKSELPPAPALAPFPNGGYPAFRNYLIREQKRPEGVPHPEGNVKLKFIVEADGSVRDIQVVRSMGEEHDAEAIRLVCEGPGWRPGIINGRRAAQTVRLDVPFR